MCRASSEYHVVDGVCTEVKIEFVYDMAVAFDFTIFNTYFRERSILSYNV